MFSKQGSVFFELVLFQILGAADCIQQRTEAIRARRNLYPSLGCVQPNLSLRIPLRQALQLGFHGSVAQPTKVENRRHTHIDYGISSQREEEIHSGAKVGRGDGRTVSGPPANLGIGVLQAFAERLLRLA
jgi:hypothetical protein